MPERRKSEKQWAIYDLYATKLVGGLSCKELAKEWLRAHLPHDLYGPDGVRTVRVATAFEADLLLQDHVGWTRRPAPERDFVIAYDY